MQQRVEAEVAGFVAAKTIIACRNIGLPKQRRDEIANGQSWIGVVENIRTLNGNGHSLRLGQGDSFPDAQIRYKEVRGRSVVSRNDPLARQWTEIEGAKASHHNAWPAHVCRKRRTVVEQRISVGVASRRN